MQLSFIRKAICAYRKQQSLLVGRAFSARQHFLSWFEHQCPVQGMLLAGRPDCDCSWSFVGILETSVLSESLLTRRSKLVETAWVHQCPLCQSQKRCAKVTWSVYFSELFENLGVDVFLCWSPFTLG